MEDQQDLASAIMSALESRDRASSEAQAQPQEEYFYDVYQRKFEETQKKRSAGKRYIAQQVLAYPKHHEALYKSLNDILNTEAPEIKPFEETPQFKSAEALVNDNDFRKRSVFVDVLANTINSVESAPPEEQANLAKTFLTSLVNSAKGTGDAEQGNEFVRRSLELLNLPEYAQQTGKNLLDSATIGSFLLTKEGKSFSEKFLANPQAYLKKAKTVHDDVAKAWNNQVYNRIIIPTNPEYAKRFGVVFKKTFQEQQKSQPVFGQAVQTAPGLTVTSGAGQMIAPTQQPVTSGTQQMQAPAGRGETYYRIVPRK